MLGSTGVKQNSLSLAVDLDDLAMYLSLSTIHAAQADVSSMKKKHVYV